MTHSLDKLIITSIEHLDCPDQLRLSINRQLPNKKLETNLKSVKDYFRVSYIGEPDSIYNNVVKVPPGKIMEFTNPSSPPHVSTYWSLKKVISDKQRNLNNRILKDEILNIKNLLKNTVDCFNSKTVQSSMGSLVRVTCYYKDDLSKYLKSLKKPVIGAESGGKSIYSIQLPKSASYIFGSESHGLSQEIKDIIDYSLAIPSYRVEKGAESLNVSVAAAIFLSEIYRP